MLVNKADIINQLQKDILPLQGYRPAVNNAPVQVGLNALNHAFPNAVFPLGAVHEFCCAGTEDTAATAGFIAGIAGKLMQKGGITLWISSSRLLFPPALKLFGIEPDKIIFIDLQKEKDVLWAVEEALKCEGLSAVIGELKDFNFTASRRLQLAVEKSRVTGFIIRKNFHKPNITASIARWRITSLPSMLENDMPGVGFPRWNVELLKIRNGTPGSWKIEWSPIRNFHICNSTPIQIVQHKKTG
ncbi:MAG TPA: Error-prone repair protein ImuA [Chitinophagaceae bacterium]